jgi:hypothetical protein
MNRVPAAILLLMVLVPGAWAYTSSAPPELTLDPAMTKGAPAALVTIVEFSDYQ